MKTKAVKTTTDLKFFGIITVSGALRAEPGGRTNRDGARGDGGGSSSLIVVYLATSSSRPGSGIGNRGEVRWRTSECDSISGIRPGPTPR